MSAISFFWDRIEGAVLNLTVAGLELVEKIYGSALSSRAELVKRVATIFLCARVSSPLWSRGSQAVRKLSDFDPAPLLAFVFSTLTLASTAGANCSDVAGSVEKSLVRFAGWNAMKTLKENNREGMLLVRIKALSQVARALLTVNSIGKRFVPWAESACAVTSSVCFLAQMLVSQPTR